MGGGERVPVWGGWVGGRVWSIGSVDSLPPSLPNPVPEVTVVFKQS